MITGNNKNSFLFMHAIYFSKISHIHVFSYQSTFTSLKIQFDLPLQYLLSASQELNEI